jgi:integral membrane protein
MFKKNLLRFFLFIANAEGISYLLLLGIAVPLKYLAGYPQPVRIIGMAHGVLFVLYILLAFAVMEKYQKSIRWFMLAFILSLIPFGTFYLERTMKK